MLDLRTRSVSNAEDGHLDLGGGISLWYRCWGNPSGIPVLFVHGGPGQCVADYKDVNEKFFEADIFHVIEVDQRGTGSSMPSVRLDYKNMQRYTDISIAQMSADFEVLRAELGIEQWLVFGGSWGSTLGLDYAERYADRCLGLILRGIYLNTKPEFDAVYARDSFAGNERRLKEFDIFLEVAADEAARLGEPPVDPSDSQRIVRLYDQLIQAGDRRAIWRFYVFENNIIEEDPAECLDPLVIDEEEYAEAMSVSFFEARLFLRGTFEKPIDLLGSLPALLAGGRPVHTWVVQGTGDEVCPEVFAQQLVAGLEAAGVPHRANFVDAGHKCSSDGMSKALRVCVDEFVEQYGMESAAK